MKQLDEMSLCERELFFTRAVADLIDDMSAQKDLQGLQALHNNLATLTEYAEKAEVETELAARREEIVKSVDRAHRYVLEGGVSYCVADLFEDIAETMRLYMDEAADDDPIAAEFVEKRALNNARIAIQEEEQRLAALPEA